MRMTAPPLGLLYHFYCFTLAWSVTKNATNRNLSYSRTLLIPLGIPAEDSG